MQPREFVLEGLANSPWVLINWTFAEAQHGLDDLFGERIKVTERARTGGDLVLHAFERFRRPALACSNV